MHQIQPIYAEITAHCDKFTTARLMLFDKPVAMTFSNEDHEDAAREWVADWNEHFAIEWDAVRATPAAMMEGFHRCLLARGVDEQTLEIALENAMKDVKPDAKG